MRVKQLVTSFTATFDQFAKKIENHEAVAEHVIADVRAAAARLRVQSGRVQADIDRRTAVRDEALQAAKRWQQRALAVPADQEAQAIECLRRAEQASKDARIADAQIARCEGLLDEVQAAQRDVETRLADLKHRSNTLASRTARADVLAYSQDLGFTDETDAVFERWEQAVLEKEYLDAGAGSAATDRFERDFDQAEHAAALKARLDALRAQRGGEEASS